MLYDKQQMRKNESKYATFNIVAEIRVWNPESNKYREPYAVNRHIISLSIAFLLTQKFTTIVTIIIHL